MRSPPRASIAATLLLGLVACGAVEELQGIGDNQKAAEQAIAQATGAETQIGWNWTNGRLTDVTVSVDARAVGDKTVKELGALVAPLVAQNFEETPDQVQILLVLPARP